MRCRVVDGGELGSKRHVNFRIRVDLPSITKKDKKDIALALKGVDFVALSFVRSKSDVLELKNPKRRNSSAKVISKMRIKKASIIFMKLQKKAIL